MGLRHPESQLITIIVPFYHRYTAQQRTDDLHPTHEHDDLHPTHEHDVSLQHWYTLLLSITDAQYEVATISKLLKMIGLFWKRAL